MKRIAVLAFELAIVVISIIAADILQRHVEIIPDFIVHLPDVDYAREDVFTVVKYSVVIYTVLILIGQLSLRPWKFADAGRTVDEIFVFAAAFAVSSLTIFVTTTVSFDPQLMAGIGVISIGIIVVTHVAAILTEESSRLFPTFFSALWKRLLSVPGILVILLALSPGVLAVLFTTNRDIANLITEIRISMTGSDELPWQFVNAAPDHSFTQPIALQFAPNDEGTLYVLQRGGQLFSVPWGEPGGKVLLLDISERIGDIEVENGALGFDFHPGYSFDNRYLYLYYTSVHNGVQANYLSRFDLEEESPDARMKSELVLINWNRNNSGFHNGGSVEFGPDGFLYVAIGDMTDEESMQRFNRELVSGVFRIDVDMEGGDVSHPIINQPVTGQTANYYIPSDNPLVGSGNLEEYWAWGLRNPFRISFDPETGEIWAGDVGTTIWEEVNLVQRGGNYQYPYIEGREATGLPVPGEIVGPEVGPLYTYRHTAYDRAVIGGVVYRGDKYSQLDGQYVFGDNYSGKVFLMPANAEQVDTVETIARAPQYAQRGMTSFIQTPGGDILLTTMGSMSEATGLVLSLVPAGTGEEAVLVTEDANQEISQEAVAEIFRTNCTRCHGESGAGDGPDAEHLGVPLPDFGGAEFQSERDDDSLRTVIADGGLAAELSPLMPPFGLVLSDSELNAMVEYVRSLERSPSNQP